ncbi:hypothetical protein [Limnohabitans sp.]|uniref:hypothetical protein n=1 Tax=Limnohabitans sp. TaxID=1907725 RepID=UPI002FDDA5DF
MLLRERFLIIILLIITFVSALRVDGELIRIPTAALLIFTLFYFKYNLTIIITALGFATFCIIHTVFLVFSGQNIIDERLFLADLSMYIAQLIFYSLVFWSLDYDKNEFIILNFFKIYLLFTIAIWISSYISGFNIAVDTSYSTPRAQGLVTEPSNLSHFLPALIIYFFKSFDVKWLFVALLTMILTFSPTVYLSLIFTMILIGILSINIRSVLYFILPIIFIILIVVFNWGIILTSIADFGQFGEMFVRIIEGFNFIFSGGSTGANSRGVLIYDGMDFMSINGLWWIGTGFGSSNAVAIMFNDGMLYDANNWFSFILWFGLPGFVFLLLLHFALLVELRDRFSKSNLTFIDFLLSGMIISNTINGGGVWIQHIFFALIVFRLLKLNVSRLSNISNVAI